MKYYKLKFLIISVCFCDDIQLMYENTVEYMFVIPYSKKDLECIRTKTSTGQRLRFL
jgi:hypothetical protein